MELRHLRYFVAIAETGSLTVAAERKLHTSQPSLSRQIKDLEDQVGTPLLSRSSRGVVLTEAGKAFLDHARLALHQVDAAVEAARRAAQPAKQRFAMGFLTGQEMTWLPEAMRVLRAELPNIDVTVSSDYSPDLGEALARGRLDVAFMRAEPDMDLAYRRVSQEPLIALMSSDHPLAARTNVRAKDLEGLPFIAMANKATVLRPIIDEYLASEGVKVTQAQFVDNPAMVMSLVASTRGVSLIPSYVEPLMPWSVVSRPLAGKAPMVDLVVGYSPSNQSPILHLFLSHLDELIARVRKSET
jgi:LysR family hca operon transcriptional activator